MEDSVTSQEVVLRGTAVVDRVVEVDQVVEVVLPSEILDRLHLYPELCSPDHFTGSFSDGVSVITQSNL